MDDSEWQRKGGTLSDKTARKEYGLTQDELVEAIQAGRLQYRRGAIHGNPVLRLLLGEVEALVKKERGETVLKDRQAGSELSRINRELKRLKNLIAALEERRTRSSRTSRLPCACTCRCATSAARSSRGWSSASRGRQGTSRRT